jgi:uncharacterized protein YgbK (DUF1537 family)
MGVWARGSRPGVILVGSHVSRSTRQLQTLLADPNISPIKVEVDRIATQRDDLLYGTLTAIRRQLAQGRTPVIYTSRRERLFATEAERLDFGAKVSAFLMNVVRRLPEDIGYLISKGGITSNDTLAHGLGLASSRVLGQILPGVSLVRCPADHPAFPDLPVVIFPGNVGDDDALLTAYQRMARPPLAKAA